MHLVTPKAEHLERYVAALRRGWTYDPTRGDAATRDELERIAHDPAAFLAAMDDREARGGPYRMPDGSEVPRIPSFRRWMWDDDFCGSISLRWQPGTTALPPYCLGHIGYAVVPWRRREGIATRALGLMLPEAWALGLPFVEVTTDPANVASQRVIEANGAVLHETFVKPPQFGATPGLRYRIYAPARDASRTSPTSPTLRRAAPADVAAIQRVGVAADTRYVATAHPELCDGESIPTADALRAIEQGRLTVAEVDGAVAGWVVVGRLGGELCLGHLCVAPEHGRRGLGAALLDHVVERARAAGERSIVLNTQRDIPWCMPWYARRGFVVVPREAWSEALAALTEAQSEGGLDWSSRVHMRLQLVGG